MPQPNMVLTEADNGKTVSVAAGSSLAVELPENASTGYRWSPDPPPLGAVALVGTEHETSTATGGSGKVRFEFKAKDVAAAKLRFKYWRPFEGDSSVQKEFGVTVQVTH